MVFFFMAGPVGVFAGGGGRGAHLGGPNAGANNNNGRAQGEDVQGTLLFSLALVVLTFLLSGSYPYAVPLLTLFVHFFPTQFDQLRTWFVENRSALMYLLIVLFMVSFPAVLYDDDDDEDYTADETSEAELRQHYQQQRQQEAEARRTSHHARAHARSPPPVDGFEGSMGGSVLADFGFTVLLISAVLMLPHIWMRVNRGILGLLPESGRARWRRWTQFIRPSAAPPGSVPTSRDALRRLEDLEVTEAHLLAENSPGGITCAVCLDAMRVGQRVKRLPCRHMFHPGCVLPWLDKHNSCPTCRHELETSDPDYELQRQERARRQQQEDDERRRRAAAAPARPAAPVAQAARPVGAAAAGARGWLGFGASSAGGLAAQAAPSSVRRDEEAGRLMRLSVPELRAIANRRSVNLIGAIEKRDLVDRILGGGFR